jgi:hypothetical protein
MKAVQFFERSIGWHAGAVLSLASLWHATELRMETGSAGMWAMSAVISCFYLFAYLTPGRN